MSVYLPRWPVQLARRRRPPADARLLVQTQRGVQSVAACCRRAEQAGVRIGMSLIHARTLLAGCTIDEPPYAPADDDATLRKLAEWAYRYSPVVAPQPPDGLLLEVAGSAHLFGGEVSLARRMAQRLARGDLTARIAIAPTFGAAWALARFVEQAICVVDEAELRAALGPLPIAALRVDAKMAASLAEVGIERVDQLLAMPRDSLAARACGAALRRLDQAIGRVAETLDSVRPQAPPEARRAFDGAVTNLEAIELSTRELLEDLVERLARDGLGACELRVVLARLSDPPITLRLRLTHPSQDARHLWSLLHPRLSRVPLGFGVEELRLWAARTEQVAARQATLWSGPQNAQAHDRDLGEFLDRLIDRFGGAAVFRIEPREAFLPEEAFASRSAAALDARTRARDAPATVLPNPRPAALFEVPEPAQVVALVPDGPPALLRWRGREHRIRSGLGPERLLPPWWAAPPRGGRDYYGVQDEAGRWLWLFRDESGRWFVHGAFA